MIVAARMTTRAPHVALGDLGLDLFPRRPRTPEIEQLDLTGAMVEVQAARLRAAIHAPVISLEGVEPFPALADVAVCVNLVRRWIRAVTRRLPLLVALPCFRRVVGFSACHEVSLSNLDYWGDESLGTAEMPEAAA